MKQLLKFKFLTLSLIVGGLLSFTFINSNIPNIYPLEGEVNISSEYGKRIHPITKKEAMHNGVDFKASLGTLVLATADGTVYKVESLPKSYGNKITIEHQGNFQTIYAQLETIKVKEGDKVFQKDIIGTVGNTGKSTGPHLHYEVILNHHNVNPLDYINQE